MTEPRVTETRAKQRRHEAKKVFSLNDIGPIPSCDDPERRAKGENSLRFFLETYFPRVFGINWSPDHLEVIHKTEQAVTSGQYFALAMPRGSGKSSIHQRAAIWALVYGKVDFVMLVCADAR